MKNNDFFNDFQALLVELVPDEAHFKIALSGGLDSVVLLHLFSRLEKRVITAHHVHHGLSENADQWLTFCREFCDLLNIPLLLSHVNVDKKKRTSLEALAREKRYSALQEGFNDQSYLVTAHHQDDQLETVLLALKRGAGLTGLQGIVSKQSLIKGHLIRPLLNFPREQLESYARQFSLHWIEDESNSDQQFDRNFIRHSITPLLKQRWPAITKTVARSALHCQTQQQLINQLTESDFTYCQSSPLVLKIVSLKTLTEARRNNVLREWFKQAKLQYPSTKQLSVIWQDLVLAKSDAQPKIILQGLALCRYQASIYFVDESRLITKPQQIKWQSQAQIIIDTGRFQVKIHAENDFLNKQYQIDIRFRDELSSGFQCHPLDRGKSRSIKKLLHEYQVPPWLRDSVPFVFINDELIEVIGLFKCASKFSKLVCISII